MPATSAARWDAACAIESARALELSRLRWSLTQKRWQRGPAFPSSGSQVSEGSSTLPPSCPLTSHQPSSSLGVRGPCAGRVSMSYRQQPHVCALVCVSDIGKDEELSCMLQLGETGPHSHAPSSKSPKYEIAYPRAAHTSEEMCCPPCQLVPGTNFLNGCGGNSAWPQANCE